MNITINKNLEKYLFLEGIKEISYLFILFLITFFVTITTIQTGKENASYSYHALKLRDASLLIELYHNDYQKYPEALKDIEIYNTNIETNIIYQKNNNSYELKDESIFNPKVFENTKTFTNKPCLNSCHKIHYSPTKGIYGA